MSIVRRVYKAHKSKNFFLIAVLEKFELTKFLKLLNMLTGKRTYCWINPVYSIRREKVTNVRIFLML